MLLVVFLAAFLAGAWSADDFYQEYYSYEFIYHGHYNLMLTIKDNSCYFARVPHDRDATQNYIGDTENRKVFERYLMHLVRHRSDEDAVDHSDLASVRDEFNDLLADFTCEFKEIYTIDLDYDDVKDYVEEHDHDGWGHGFLVGR